MGALEKLKAGAPKKTQSSVRRVTTDLEESVYAEVQKIAEAKNFSISKTARLLMEIGLTTFSKEE